MDKQLQNQINDQIALTLGRQMIELIAAQATIAALQQALSDTRAEMQKDQEDLRMYRSREESDLG